MWHMRICIPLSAATSRPAPVRQIGLLLFTHHTCYCFNITYYVLPRLYLLNKQRARLTELMAISDEQIVSDGQNVFSWSGWKWFITEPVPQRSPTLFPECAKNMGSWKLERNVSTWLLCHFYFNNSNAQLRTIPGVGLLKRETIGAGLYLNRAL